MTSAAEISDHYIGLEDNPSSIERFHHESVILLDEIGNALRMHRVIRHYEIEEYPATRSDPGELIGIYFNRRLDRSVEVRIGEYASSTRQDGLACKVRLVGASSSGGRDPLHTKRLSAQHSVTLNFEAIYEMVQGFLSKLDM